LISHAQNRGDLSFGGTTRKFETRHSVERRSSLLFGQFQSDLKIQTPSAKRIAAISANRRQHARALFTGSYYFGGIRVLGARTYSQEM
jgi:hypothetical protein